MIYLKDMVNYSMFFLSLPPGFFCAERVEWVILSHTLSFLLRGLLHAQKLWVGGVVDNKILVTAQRPNSHFPFWIWDLASGLLITKQMQINNKYSFYGKLSFVKFFLLQSSGIHFRLCLYIVPVILLSIILNIPKFFETVIISKPVLR